MCFALLRATIMCSVLILMYVPIFAQSSLYVASPPLLLSQSDPKLIPNPATLTRKSPILMHAHTHSVFLPRPRPHTPVTHIDTRSLFLSLCVPVHSISTPLSKQAVCTSYPLWCFPTVISSQCGGISRNSYCNDISFSFCSHKEEFGSAVSLCWRLSGNVNWNLLQSIYCKKTAIR